MTVLLRISFDKPLVLERLFRRGTFLGIRLNQSDTESFRIVRNLLPEFSLTTRIREWLASSIKRLEPAAKTYKRTLARVHCRIRSFVSCALKGR